MLVDFLEFEVKPSHINLTSGIFASQFYEYRMYFLGIVWPDEAQVVAGRKCMAISPGAILLWKDLIASILSTGAMLISSRPLLVSVLRLENLGVMGKFAASPFTFQ